MSAVRSEAFYADLGSVERGRRFCIVHRPDGARLRGALVHVHAFADEMNKSRRVVSIAARALAARGWATVLIDLAGCGDDPGELKYATWDGWVNDALTAHRWASGRFAGPCWLWGLRAGCLIAAEAGARLDGAAPMLLWQPVLSGELHLTQFLRLRLASEAMGDRLDERTGPKALRAQLAEGTPVEIAGYLLNPDLAAGLDRAELKLDRQRAQVVVQEVSTDADPRLAPATVARIAEVQSRGVAVDATAVTGPHFWRSIEIEECTALVDATVAALQATDAVAV